MLSFALTAVPLSVADDESSTSAAEAADALSAMAALVEQELERLQLDLQLQRELQQPNRSQILAQLVADIEYRQEKLDDLRNMQAALTTN